MGRLLFSNRLFRSIITVKRTLISRQLQYGEHGDPTKVISLKDVDLGSISLRPNEIRLNFLASPINPADINTIQGVYPIKPSSFPAVGGNEGVARVEECGTDVKNLRVGDWVQPKLANFGTWRTIAICDGKNVTRIDNTLALVDAATLSVNPPTAYRILSDFVQLSPGDTIIQNGANSAVGRALIQLANLRGYVTVNIVRPRPNLDELKQELEQLGANYVLTEDEFKGEIGKRIWLASGVKLPKLAVNCVGGRSTLYLAAALDQGGVLVTYGAMAMQPLQFPAGPFIFKGIQARGFWLAKWKGDEKNETAASGMFSELAKLIKEGKLKTSNCDMVDYKDYKGAIEKSMLKGYSKKQILVFDWSL